MFLEQNAFLGKRSNSIKGHESSPNPDASKGADTRFSKRTLRHWAPGVLFLPLALAGACLSTADSQDTILGLARQAFTGRDVPSSVGITDQNGQYTWDPQTNAGQTHLQHDAISPDGAFMLLTGGAAASNWYVRPIETLSAVTTPDAGTIEHVDLGQLTLESKQITLPTPNIGGNLTIAGLGAVSFDPRFGLGPLRIENPLDCANATKQDIPVAPADPYDCYRMVTYAQAREITTVNGTSVHDYYIAIAPLRLVINRNTRAIEASNVVLGEFQRIRAQGDFVKIRTDGKKRFSDHFTATADGRLILYGPAPKYTFSPDPLALDNFWEPEPFFDASHRNTCISLSVDASCANADASLGCENVGPECASFGHAYPVFQSDFRFVDGTTMSTDVSCAYPWITPDGTDLFCNAGSISAVAMIGQSTKGIFQHVDGQVQTTQHLYCKLQEDGSPCDPMINSVGIPACSPRGANAGDACGGDSDATVGSHRISSLGAATGPWSPRAGATDAGGLPLLHRSPSLLMLSNNVALDYFGIEPEARVASFVYFEVPLDASTDPDFAAFFHMNEAIWPQQGGTWMRAAPFGDTDPANGAWAKRIGDASGHGYVGMLKDGALFPFDRNGRVEHPISAPPNPGFIGRAVYFPVPGGQITVAKKFGNNPLGVAHDALTLELAVKIVSLPSGGPGKIIIAASPSSYELSFDPGTGTISFAVQGASQVASFVAAIDPGQNFTRLALTYRANSAANPPTPNTATVALYKNGQHVNNSTLTFAGSAALPAPSDITRPLCIGPGCTVTAFTGTTGYDSGELLIDEVGISSVVRSNEYIAAAALADGPTDVFAPGAPLSWYQNLPDGLEANEIRIPKAILNEVNTSSNPQQKFARIAALGKALFVDDVLAVNANACGGRPQQPRSCATCHDPANYFAHQGENLDLGINGSELDTNTPSLLGRAFSTRQLKDRSEASLLHQANRVIENPIEMGGNLTKIVSCLNRTTSPENIPAGYPPSGVTTYRQWFNYAFAGSTSINNAVTPEQVLGAIATYELTLNSGGSAVDQMLISGSSNSTILLDGLRIFQGKGRCAGCHSGANFTDELRHVTSVGGNAIKTPSLRNVSHTDPYFHDGAKLDLHSVVEHYNRCGAIDINGACAPELVALGLTVEEMDALIAFLQGLSSPIP